MDVLIISTVENTLSEACRSTMQQVEMISKLSKVASNHPYYKYNSMWTRDMQNAVGLSVLVLWRLSNKI